MSLDLSIIIVSYNARDDLARCLESLRSSPPRIAHDVLVVDNASTDGSPEVARARFPEVRLLETGENVGFARATNQGIRASTGSMLLVLNSDTQVPAGAIDSLVGILHARADVGVVGPRLVNDAGTVEISWGPMLGPVNEVRQKTLGLLHRRGFPLVVSYVSRLSRIEHYPDWVSGACLLVRRADAEAAGLFDDRYFLYGEDVDFCAAVRRLGKRILFTPAAEIVHRRGRSVAADPRTSAAAYRRSQLAFYAKHHPRWVPALRAYLAVKGDLP